MFKVAIIGGENTENYERFRNKCIFLLQNKAKEGITIYSIGDCYVDDFAKRYNIDVKNFYTEWKKYGKDALKNRNIKLCSECDALIYFNDGIKDHKMIHTMAVDNNIPCRVISL